MINLLPNKLKQERKYGKRNVTLLGYSIALVATAIATAGIMLVSLRIIGSDESTLRAGLTESQTKIATLESEVKSIETIATNLEVAETISNQSVRFSELIPKIGAVLPEGVVLNGLSLTGGITDPLRLDVDLLNANLAPIMIRNLVESDLFEAADIQTLAPIGAAPSDTGSSYSFTASITASFTGTAEVTKKAAAKEAAKRSAAAAAAAEQAKKSGTETQ